MRLFDYCLHSRLILINTVCPQPPSRSFLLMTSTLPRANHPSCQNHLPYIVYVSLVQSNNPDLLRHSLYKTSESVPLYLEPRVPVSSANCAVGPLMIRLVCPAQICQHIKLFGMYPLVVTVYASFAKSFFFFCA